LVPGTESGNKTEDRDMRVALTFVAVLALVLVVGVSAMADDKPGTHEGKVVSVAGDKLTMTDKDGKNEHSHMVPRDAKVTCDGKDCKLEDLKKGYGVRVTIEKKGDKTVVTKIEGRKT
jgi:hypothetical protein